MERLQKIIASAGLCSRRQAEEWILAGRVAVNGRPVSLGDRADPEKDLITVDGKRIGAEEEKIYAVLYKPRGYLSAVSDSRGRKTAAELVRGLGGRLYPVGRLDYTSEGLLLMTNDGDFANAVMRPGSGIEKEYLVSVRGWTAAAASRLEEPIEIEGKMTRPAHAEVVSEDGTQAKLRFVLREGRNRQVRRLCERAELEVRRLIRVREGCVELNGLRPGEYRKLTDREIAALTGGENKERE